MTDVAQWQASNNAYLHAALAWLRLRLAKQAGPTPVSMVAAPAPPARKGWFRSSPPVAIDPTATKEVTETEVAAAAKLVEAAETSEPPPALVILAGRFGLSLFERQVLLLCAATELDTRIAPLCARACDDPARPFPTFALALSLFEEPAWDAMSPERPLRASRLVDIHQPGAQPLTMSALRADERIVSYIKGLNYLDDRLTPFLVPFDVVDDGADLPPSQQAHIDAIVARLRLAVASARLPVIQLVGPDAPSKQLVAARAAAELGLHLYRLPAAAAPTGASELETLARLWQRESQLLPVALYVDAHETPGGTDVLTAPFSRILSRLGSVTFLDSRDVDGPVDWRGANSPIVFDVAKPLPAEQRDAWAAALTPTGRLELPSQFADVPERLAGQFSLSLSAIRQIAGAEIAAEGHAATAASSSDAGRPGDRLWDACLASTRPRLDRLAERLDAKATWDDIVLPPESIDLLRQISGQVAQRNQVYEAWGFHGRMNRGLGISALFTGESGTGKTMAAEVVANDLRLNLYRIDLSAVVSKYIGETEKNLRRVFDAAEDGGAILFFDEADALFGKRSEVRDSHDRYANIEINYLLQRMEAFRGLAILATNMKNALDTAFARRLRFAVNFAFPGSVERRMMWAKAFPDATPVVGLDIERLARLNLTGGSIHNIALSAAFRAAHDRSPVTMALVLDAARTELRKIERPINEADFRTIEAVGGKS